VVAFGAVFVQRQARLLSGGFDAAAGNVEVGGTDFNAYAAPAQEFGSDEGSAGTEEWVKDGLALLRDFLQ
jgi:hypothetical protein